MNPDGALYPPTAQPGANAVSGLSLNEALRDKQFYLL
jgi:hypothetical protein